MGNICLFLKVFSNSCWAVNSSQETTLNDIINISPEISKHLTQENVMVKGICFQWDNVWIRSSRLYPEGTQFISRGMNIYVVS